jgi:hypothetical protein
MKTGKNISKLSWITAVIIGYLSSVVAGSATGQAQEKGELETVLTHLKDRFSASKTFQADYIRDLVPKVG